MNTLSPTHLASLHASAISDLVIHARGYRTVTAASDLRSLGFSPAQCRVPGLLLPLCTTAGTPGPAVYRPDNPRVVEQKDSPRDPDGLFPNKVIKYEMPKGLGVHLDCPPLCQPDLGDPRIPLWITEGQKKADALVSAGLTAIALLGVWNFKGKNESGGVTLLADWDFIALKDRDVRIVFDSDVMRKREVQAALLRLVEHLRRKGAELRTVYLPPGPGSEKLGVDDWLALGHTLPELESLLEAPRPAPTPAPNRVELLDTPPLTLRRPLALLDGVSYAASWHYIQVTKTEGFDKRRDIVKYDPPRKVTELSLFVTRQDGLIFGEGGDRPLDDLPLQVHLPEPPPLEQTWSALGLKAYHRGERPDPVAVFARLVDVVDAFIDFDRSLAPQRTMAELVACYALASWLLDAFNAIGFLWSNGDRGCGKTQLLVVVCKLAYLGQVILAGGSFASLRDLADYGATLAFDDAENLSDPRRTDPDKRALLLAGNHRGVFVPLKELGPDKKWFTRRVNAFCPRLFSAIRPPDPVLASRAIVVPLIRTADYRRANADPSDLSTWPHDQRQLLDDLWALTLHRLPDLPAYDRWVGDHAPLSGRNLQPWRAVLAVARWLDDQGLSGLWDRLAQLSLDYQQERPDLETSDLTLLVIRALIRCARLDLGDIKAIGDINVEDSRFILYTAEITEAALKIAKDDEIDVDLESITSRRIGRVLSKMRFKKDRQNHNGSRQWVVTTLDLHRLALSYGLITPPIESPDDSQLNGPNGPDVTPDESYLQGTL